MPLRASPRQIINTCFFRCCKTAWHDRHDQTATGYVAGQFSGVKTVKAFNSIYFTVLEDQALRLGSEGQGLVEDQRIAVQVAGNDNSAKQTVMQLIAEISFATQDIGTLDDSTIYEPNAPCITKTSQSVRPKNI